MDKTVYRIIDANANRSREGIRVIEDCVRFLWDDAALCNQLKKYRHMITELIKQMNVSTDELLYSRESSEDVGKDSKLATEAERQSIENIITVNLKRVQEATRVLEEITKLEDILVSARFKEIRFRFYTLEKELLFERKETRI